MAEKKKNIPMIVALSVPILMVVFIAISIYVPALFVKPSVDFVYSTGWNYCDDFQFIVSNEKIIMKEYEKRNEYPYCNNHEEARLFYFDVKENRAREITFEEAQVLRVDKRLQSPDGFEVVSSNDDFDFFFGGSSRYDKYLKKGVYSRRIEMDKKYYYNFNFLGWIKE